MYCPKCKRLVEDNSVYCEYCGNKLKRSRWPLIGIIIGAVITVLVVIIVAVTLSSKAQDEGRVFFNWFCFIHYEKG